MERGPISLHCQAVVGTFVDDLFGDLGLKLAAAATAAIGIVSCHRVAILGGNHLTLMTLVALLAALLSFLAFGFWFRFRLGVGMNGAWRYGGIFWRRLLSLAFKFFDSVLKFSDLLLELGERSQDEGLDRRGHLGFDLRGDFDEWF